MIKKPAGAQALAPQGERPNKAVALAQQAVRVDRFADGSEIRSSAIDIQVQLIRQAAKMADSENPDLRVAGMRDLRFIAAASLGAEMLPQVESQKASTSASAPRKPQTAGATVEAVQAYAKERGYPGSIKYELLLSEGAAAFGISETTFRRRLAGDGPRR